MHLITHPERWNALIAQLPVAHVLQTWEWGQVKARFGWTPHAFLWGNETRPQAAALVLERHVPIGGFAARLRVMYVPKGPLMDWGDADLRRQVLDDLQAYARRRGAIFLKVDPDVPLGRGVPGEPGAQEDPLGRDWQQALAARGWRFSREQVQFRNTVLIDLTPDEETLLARMKQKTRYNVRLARRKGVVVRVGNEDDLPLLYRMYAETAARDGFVIRPRAYYQAVWRTFMQAGMAEPLIAEVEGEPVAAVVIFRFAGRAWYLYGMSRAVHRNKMPTYLLQWEAMRRAKAAGCTVYDLWGAPDVFDERDSMWGVFRFKRGLGGEVVRTLGAWDYPARPWLYRLYGEALPRLLDWLRRRRMREVQDEAR